MKSEHPIHVIKTPVLTEESNLQTTAFNKYVFKVDPRANKKQIREAIEKHWTGVKVVKVNTMNYDGKIPGRRAAGSPGSRPNWKKAIVSLREGDTIDLI